VQGLVQEPVRIRRERDGRVTRPRIRVDRFGSRIVSVVVRVRDQNARVSEFDEATQVDDQGRGRIHDGWDIGGNANGGYLLALAAQGLRAIAGRPDPVTITAHFLAPGIPGDAVVEGAIVKAGKRFTTVSGSLVSNGRTIIQVLGTFGDLASSAASDYVSMNGLPPSLPSMEHCVKRTARDDFPVPLMDRLDVRLHPDHTGWLRGERTGVGEIAGWFAFADDRPIDTLALLLVADALPPAVFNLDIPSGWVPTVELTVHVRAVPAPGPVRCVFRTRFVHGGMLEEDGEVWDSRGSLVALSRQLALLPR
jgi:acyl-coenzyme A thioesterase PaaI-like protein